MSAIRWCLCMLVVCLSGCATASGVFEMRIKTFSNDGGRDAESRCCRATRVAGSERCSQTCVTKFRVCLTNYQLKIDLDGQCVYGEYTTAVLGENSLSLVANNSVEFAFDGTWPGYFSLVLEAWHQSPEASSLTTGNSLIMRLNVSRYMAPSEQWLSDAYASADHALTYDLRVKCDAHYYGDGCTKLCRPRDDKFGHYTCSQNGDRKCLPGWTGEYCTQAICLPGCHEKHGSCSVPNECVCRTGWKGPFCDQCIRHPGCLHGSCQQPYQCNCDEGWGGPFCNQDLNYCTNHKPCKNGGTCYNTGESLYTCSCPEEYTGTDCEVLRHDCRLLPCLNGGSCTGTAGNSSCQCAAGFHGPRCEMAKGPSCADKPCLHGATCIDTIDKGYLCTCPPGFDGPDCSRQIDECATNPCQNGGSCLNEVQGGGVRCICAPGFDGSRCEIDINDCASNPCLNGGSCLDRVNSFTCLCVPGFTGLMCQTNIDECLFKPCANGGICHDLIHDFRCSCRPGFTGKDCSIKMDQCASRPCLNGGTCLNQLNRYLCQCPVGFTGSRCQLPEIAGPYTGDSEESLSMEQIVLIATFSTAIPILAAVSCVVILCMKKKRRKEQQRADEEARRQNEQNVVHSISKKMEHLDKCLDEHRIVNTLDYPKNKCVNDPDPVYGASLKKPLNTDPCKMSGKFSLAVGDVCGSLSPPLRDKEHKLSDPACVALDKRLDSIETYPVGAKEASSSTKNSNETSKRPYPLPARSSEDVLATAV